MSRGHALFFLLAVLIGSANATLASKPIEAALSDFNDGQYDAALQHFRQLHEASPDDPDLTFYLARSLYRKLELETAESLLLKSIERHPQHVESHYLLGSVQLSRVAEVNLFRKAGLAKSALKSWEQAVELDPDHAEALYGVASFYLSAPGIAGGDQKLGKQKLAELERLSPPWADLTRASVALRDEAFDEAEQLFKTAIQGIPGRAFPTLMLANLYLKQEKYENALTTLEDYQNRDRTWNDPGPEQTALLAGKIYQGLNRPEAAIASFVVVKNGVANQNMKEQAEEALDELYAR